MGHNKPSARASVTGSMLADALRLATVLRGCANCKQRRNLIQRHIELRWFMAKERLCNARFSPMTALIALALGVVLGWLVILLVLIGRTAGG